MSKKDDRPYGDHIDRTGDKPPSEVESLMWEEFVEERRRRLRALAQRGIEKALENGKILSPRLMGLKRIRRSEGCLSKVNRSWESFG